MTPAAVILSWFPNADRRLKVKSPNDGRYNCIAWAAQDVTKHWWPQSSSYWPDPNESKPTLETFTKAFRGLGFEECDKGNTEQGYEKVVIYSLSGAVTHMARQISKGWWSSKLGAGWDVEHVTPECLSGEKYGKPIAYMRRPRAQQPQPK